MTITLRPYQEEAIAAVDEAHARGVRRPLVTLPTGCGKTLVFSTVIRRRQGTALILAHRDELLKQAADKLRTVAPELGVSIGFVRGSSDDVHAPIVIASVQTLARARRLQRLPKTFRTVVVDEAHHATAPVELFGGRDRLHWVPVDERWVISAGDDEYLVLDPFDNQWRVLLVRETGAKIIASGLDLGYAQGSAEESLRKRDGMRLAKSNAAWRSKEPTDGQLRYLRRLGVTTVPDTAGQATDLLTERLARRLLVRLDRAVARMAAGDHQAA